MRVTRSAREWLVVAATFILVFVILGSFSASRGDLATNYLVNVALTMAIYAILALGLSLEMGYTGLLNFGHAMFMGVGGYVVAIFSMRYEDALAPGLVGVSAGGVAVVALAALLAGLVVYVPLLLLAQRLARLSPRARLLASAGPALVVALAAAYAMFPLDLDGAANAIVLVGILLGMILAALVSLGLGFAGLRLREDYLAIVTLGAAEILRLVELNEEAWTRGSQGIQSLQRPLVEWANNTPWWEAFAEAIDVRPTPLVHMTVAVLAVALFFVVLETLARSPWGRVLKAIREDEEVAASLGKNVLLAKLQSLMIGSAIAAVAGIFFVWNVASVVPEHFLPVVTFYTFAILVLGGIGNHKGAILGAILIWGIFELAGNLTSLEFFRARDIQFAGPLQQLFVGLVLILVVMFRPQGVVGSKEEMAFGK